MKLTNKTQAYAQKIYQDTITSRLMPYLLIMKGSFSPFKGFQEHKNMVKKLKQSIILFANQIMVHMDKFIVGKKKMISQFML